MANTQTLEAEKAAKAKKEFLKKQKELDRELASSFLKTLENSKPYYYTLDVSDNNYTIKLNKKIVAFLCNIYNIEKDIFTQHHNYFSYNANPSRYNHIEAMLKNYANVIECRNNKKNDSENEKTDTQKELDAIIEKYKDIFGKTDDSEN